MKLTLYVESGCAGCERALSIADELDSTYAALDVQVLDLASGAEAPESVIAVPAYLLDQTLVSVGNPSIPEIRALIDQRLKGDDRLAETS